MDPINKRIAEVVAISRCTKTDFAKRINLSQSMISKLCSGAARPSDRTIFDICRIFGINEVWLRSGAGEMLDVPSREAQFLEALSPLAAIIEDDKRVKEIAHLLATVPDNVASDMLDNFAKYIMLAAFEIISQDPALRDKISPDLWDIINKYIN